MGGNLLCSQHFVSIVSSPCQRARPFVATVARARPRQVMLQRSLLLHQRPRQEIMDQQRAATRRRSLPRRPRQWEITRLRSWCRPRRQMPPFRPMRCQIMTPTLLNIMSRCRRRQLQGRRLSASMPGQALAPALPAPMPARRRPLPRRRPRQDTPLAPRQPSRPAVASRPGRSRRRRVAGALHWAASWPL